MDTHGRANQIRGECADENKEGYVNKHTGERWLGGRAGGRADARVPRTEEEGRTDARTSRKRANGHANERADVERTDGVGEQPFRRMRD